MCVALTWEDTVQIGLEIVNAIDYQQPWTIKLSEIVTASVFGSPEACKLADTGISILDRVFYCSANCESGRISASLLNQLLGQ